MNSVQSGSGLKSQPPQPLEKPPHILELERKKALLQKVRGLRESLLSQKGAVLEGDPSKDYCWVNSKDDRQMNYLAMGWKKVGKDSPVKTYWKQEDGTHRRADLILYEIDKEMSEAIHAMNTLRGIENVEQNDDAFISFLDRDKIPSFKPQVK